MGRPVEVEWIRNGFRLGNANLPPMAKGHAYRRAKGDRDFMEKGEDETYIKAGYVKRIENAEPDNESRIPPDAGSLDDSGVGYTSGLAD